MNQHEIHHLRAMYDRLKHYHTNEPVLIQEQGDCYLVKMKNILDKEELKLNYKKIDSRDIHFIGSETVQISQLNNKELRFKLVGLNKESFEVIYPQLINAFNVSNFILYQFLREINNTIGFFTSLEAIHDSKEELFTVYSNRETLKGVNQDLVNKRLEEIELNNFESGEEGWNLVLPYKS